jgi:hypothetical protein
VAQHATASYERVASSGDSKVPSHHRWPLVVISTTYRPGSRSRTPCKPVLFSHGHPGGGHESSHKNVGERQDWGWLGLLVEWSSGVSGGGKVRRCGRSHNVGGERKCLAVVGWSRSTVLCDRACVWCPKFATQEAIKIRARCKKLGHF